MLLLFFIYMNHVQVRNAIHALQEMTYSTLQSQMDLGARFPARSIPNLRNEMCSISTTNEAFSLARSSSQPADMWAREMIIDTANFIENHSNNNGDLSNSMKTIGLSIATQTDNNNIDLSIIENFITSNPRLVYSILGILEPTTSYLGNGDKKHHIQHHEKYRNLQQQHCVNSGINEPYASLSSDAQSSPEQCNVQKRFVIGISNPMSPSTSKSIIWDSPQNSSNKDTNDHCRSTDALLAISSHDCLLQSTENLISNTSLAHLSNENVNYSTDRDGYGSGKTILRSSSNSGTGGISLNILNNQAQSTGSKRKVLRKESNNSSTSISSNISISSNRKLTATVYNETKTTTASVAASTSTASIRMKDSRNKRNERDVNNRTQYDELNEKCALLAFDLDAGDIDARCRVCINRSSTTDLQKRNHLVPKPPYSYRFSAGDADKLEKGIKNIASTRSLKDTDFSDE